MMDGWMEMEGDGSEEGGQADLRSTKKKGGGGQKSGINAQKRENWQKINK